MCAVRPLVGSFPVDERNLRFGSHALVTTNAQEFIDRIAFTTAGVRHPDAPLASLARRRRAVGISPADGV